MIIHNRREKRTAKIPLPNGFINPTFLNGFFFVQQLLTVFTLSDANVGHLTFGSLVHFCIVLKSEQPDGQRQTSQSDVNDLAQ